MPKFAVILPAAGKSSRYQGPGRKKVFAELAGRPVWLRSVEAFVSREDVAQTILVISPDDEEWFREKYRANLAFLDLEIVIGGAERFDSVANGLARVRSDVDYVAVHDAARPLVAKAWIRDVFAAAIEHGAAILGTPVVSTLKRVGDDQCIRETVPRVQLWEAQTPQVARRDWIVEAFARRGTSQPTDEAQLLEQAGYPVRMVAASPVNLKITAGSDLGMAERLLDQVPQDAPLRQLHPFAGEEPRFLS